MVPNLVLLQKLKSVLKENPNRLFMGDWGSTITNDKLVPGGMGLELHNSHRYPECGTLACIAGWVILLQFGDKSADWAAAFRKFDTCMVRDLRLDTTGLKFKNYNISSRYRITGQASELLGIEEDFCPFYEMAWSVEDVVIWIDFLLDGWSPSVACEKAKEAALTKAKAAVHEMLKLNSKLNVESNERREERGE